LKTSDIEKHSFGPSKWPQKLKTAKNSKLPKLPENCFEPVGKGVWPPISTWINTPSLGRNGIHCVDFPGEREKHDAGASSRFLQFTKRASAWIIDYTAGQASKPQNFEFYLGIVAPPFNQGHSKPSALVL
jgi:hypothetical protein